MKLMLEILLYFCELSLVSGSKYYEIINNQC